MASLAHCVGGRRITRRELLKDTAAALTGLGGGLALAGCGGGEQGDTGLRPLTFLAVLPLTTLTYAPELLADAAGYFADQGLAVSFQSTRGTAQAIQLVLAGTAPVSRVGQIEAMTHVANRAAPILNIGTVIKESTLRFVSSTRAPLREPGDFVDKTFGIPSEGGESETTLDLLLASSGIDPGRVSRQVVGVGPGVFNLVDQGRIAGFIVSIDTAKILASQIRDVTVLNPAEFIESGAQIYMASAEHLGANRDALHRYLAAISAALEFIINDDGFEQTVRIIREKYSFATLDDDAIARDSLAEYVGVWTAQGRENVLETVPDAWRAGYEELVRAGRLEAGRDPSQWFTNEILLTG